MRSGSDRSSSNYEDRGRSGTGVVPDERREGRGSSSYEGYGGGIRAPGGGGGGRSSQYGVGRHVAYSSDDEERDTRRGGSPVGKKPLRPIPPLIKGLRQASVAAADDDGSDADYLENDNSARLYNRRMKAKGGGAHAMQQEEARMAEGSRRRHGGEPSREQQDYSRRHADDSEDEPPTHYGPSGRPPRGSKAVRRRDHQGEEGAAGAGKKKFVSMDEYDELSKLCDSLLAQQDQLKEELRNQANALKVRSRCTLLSVDPPSTHHHHLYSAVRIVSSDSFRMWYYIGSEERRSQRWCHWYCWSTAEWSHQIEQEQCYSGPPKRPESVQVRGPVHRGQRRPDEGAGPTTRPRQCSPLVDACCCSVEGR